MKIRISAGELGPSETRTLEEALEARAADDPTFEKSLLSDPENAIRTVATQIPIQGPVRIVKRSGRAITLLFPESCPDEEVSDELLGMINGGLADASFGLQSTANASSGEFRENNEAVQDELKSHAYGLPGFRS